MQDQPSFGVVSVFHTRRNLIMLKAYAALQARLNSLRTEEDGNAAEYGLIIAIVALGIVLGLGALALALNGMFNDVATELG